MTLQELCIVASKHETIVQQAVGHGCPSLPLKCLIAGHWCRKKMEVGWNQLDPRLRGVDGLDDIMRFDLQHFCRRMQPPDEPHYWSVSLHKLKNSHQIVCIATWWAVRANHHARNTAQNVADIRPASAHFRQVAACTQPSLARFILHLLLCSQVFVCASLVYFCEQYVPLSRTMCLCAAWRPTQMVACMCKRSSAQGYTTSTLC